MTTLQASPKTLEASQRADLIEAVAQNMHAEAYVIGMTKHAWLNEDSATQDGWRMIAEAGIAAMKSTKKGKR